METRAQSRERTPADQRAFRPPSPLVLAPLVACALWVVARIIGADRIAGPAARLTPLLAFTPYAAIASLVPVVHSAVRRNWVTCAAAVAVSGAFAALMLPRAMVDPVPPTGGPVLRVLSVNMRFGHADPRVLVHLVRRLRVDVLSLQEFTRESAAALSRAGLAAALPYRIVKPIGGALGSGLYARLPLRSLPMPDVAAVGLAMPRGEMTVPGGERVQVVVVHLAKPINRPGMRQWERGLAAIPAADHHGPVRVVAGDFNGTLDDARLRQVVAEGYADAADAAGEGLIPTFKKWNWPLLTIDHVLVDRRCAVRRVAVFDVPHTDHRAVFAALRLPRPEPRRAGERRS